MSAFDSIARARLNSEQNEKDKLLTEKAITAARKKWEEEAKYSRSEKDIIFTVLENLGIALFGKNSFFKKPKYQVLITKDSKSNHLLQLKGLEQSYPIIDVYFDQNSKSPQQEKWSAYFTISVQNRESKSATYSASDCGYDVDSDFPGQLECFIEDENCRVKDKILLNGFSQQTFETTLKNLLAKPIVPFNLEEELDLREMLPIRGVTRVKL
jgi:hypothetical protein